MTALVFGLILFSAALHASWNAIVKGGDDKLQTMILVSAFGALIGLVCLPFLPPMSGDALPFLAISVVLEIAYAAFVALAYTHADMSRAYPLMRGTPPLIVALVSTLALGMAVSLAGMAGDRIGRERAAIVAMRSSGLLVRGHSANQNKTDTVVGDVPYKERYDIRLISLEPLR